MAPGAYIEARKNSRYHLQIELLTESFPTASSIEEYGMFPIKGVVRRVFRSDGTIGIDDQVEFPICISEKGKEVPLVTDVQIVSLDHLESIRYLELFLSGQPPVCKVAGNEEEWYPIRELSDTPFVDEETGFSVNRK